MGQRHQIYLRLASGKVIGLHHQWLYGSQPIRHLYQFLQFVAGEEGDRCLSLWEGGSPYMVERAQAAFNAAYSILLSDGSHHKVHDLDAETCADPRLGDNNDGITVVDLSGPRPKFAFAFVDGGGDPGVPAKEQNKPLSAAAYLGMYYATEGDTGERAAPVGSWEYAAHVDTAYTLLTKVELKEIFPAAFKRVRKPAA